MTARDADHHVLPSAKTGILVLEGSNENDTFFASNSHSIQRRRDQSPRRIEPARKKGNKSPRYTNCERTVHLLLLAGERALEP
jgi:hypothetical protein